MTAPVLAVRRLCISTSARIPVPVVTDVDLAVGPGEAVAVVGESGSGKSVTSLACLGLLPPGLTVTSGSVEVLGTRVTGASEDELRRIRGRDIAMIFQDPMTSLDPCFTVGSQLVESVRAHERVSRREARARAVEMLEMVEIPQARSRVDHFPHEFSGGMRQRVMIAGALILRPKLLVADEPTTALDVTTQASILALVNRLRTELDMAVVWISHDLGVVAQLADRVSVMYAGEIVESARTAQLFARPAHPYTQGLIDSARSGTRGTPFRSIAGKVPGPGEWEPGCRFLPRCPHADEACTQRPSLTTPVDQHQHRCLKAQEWFR